MSYFEQLHPWCIVRTLSCKECKVVARFRRRDEAIAFLQVLPKQLDNITFTVKFCA